MRVDKHNRYAKRAKTDITYRGPSQKSKQGNRIPKTVIRNKKKLYTERTQCRPENTDPE